MRCEQAQASRGQTPSLQTGEEHVRVRKHHALFMRSRAGAGRGGAHAELTWRRPGRKRQQLYPRLLQKRHQQLRRDSHTCHPRLDTTALYLTW